MKTEKYKPEICDHCGQAKTYLLAIDRGTVNIVKAVAVAISLKGVNIIHPTKEMEVPPSVWSYKYAIQNGKLTSNHMRNFTRPRAHGLLARVKGEPGNWCLTRKGAAFLRGEAVPKFAVIRKALEEDGSHQDGYWEPDKYQVTVADFTSDDAYWEGYDYEIVEGRIVPAKEIEQKAEQKLNI